VSKQEVTIESLVQAGLNLVEAIKILRDMVLDLQDRVDQLEREVRGRNGY
jgi:hypothetical protein